jgi:hypothetical protein
MSASDLTNLRRARAENYAFVAEGALARAASTNAILRTVSLDEYDDPQTTTWFGVRIRPDDNSECTSCAVAALGDPDAPAPIFFGTPPRSGTRVDKRKYQTLYHTKTSVYAGTFSLSAGPAGMTAVSFSQ